MKYSRGARPNIAAAALILLVTAARAEGQKFLDGNELYALCTSSRSDDRAQCIGYVEAIIDAGET